MTLFDGVYRLLVTFCKINFTANLYIVAVLQQNGLSVHSTLCFLQIFIQHFGMAS